MSDRPPREPPLASERLGSGYRIALLHGFTQTGRSWQPVVDALRSRFEVVTVDLPGHGGSTSVGATSLEEAGRKVAETVGRATYVGYSMGGRVVLHAAFVAPESVRSMVLIGVSPGIEDERERVDRRRADDSLADRLQGDGNPLALSGFLDEWLAQPMFANLPPSAQGREAREENTAAGLADALRRLGTGTQVYDRERLRRLSMPILFVAGERDAKFRTLSAQMAGDIGENASTAVIASTGHAAPFESPNAFVELLCSWVREHDED
ncbi:MAG: alpha/beta fold hydrolase [Acidimicrobiales bacterium]